MRSVPERADNLKSFGAIIFVVALMFVGAVTLMNDRLPSPPVDLDVDKYRETLSNAASLIRLRWWILWIGEHMLAGGFFMWLAGHVVAAIDDSRESGE